MTQRDNIILKKAFECVSNAQAIHQELKIKPEPHYALRALVCDEIVKLIIKDDMDDLKTFREIAVCALWQVARENP